MAVLAIPALGFINPGMIEWKKGTGEFLSIFTAC